MNFKLTTLKIFLSIILGILGGVILKILFIPSSLINATLIEIVKGLIDSPIGAIQVVLALFTFEPIESIGSAIVGIVLVYLIWSLLQKKKQFSNPQRLNARHKPKV